MSHVGRRSPLLDAVPRHSVRLVGALRMFDATEALLELLGLAQAFHGQEPVRFQPRANEGGQNEQKDVVGPGQRWSESVLKHGGPTSHDCQSNTLHPTGFKHVQNPVLME